MDDHHHHSESLSNVKAEIKNWERSFRSSNGKDPTIQDIKLQPHIANKYKLYKKLSKVVGQRAAQPVPFTSANPITDSPSTPPRSQTHRSISQTSLLLSKPRVAHTTASLSTFNPFSPQKNKGKQREVLDSLTESRSNPFASPPKLKFNGSAQSRPVSPDSFPNLRLQYASELSNTPSRSPPIPTTAISRARKRLRGEFVSPSPNKEKRRRVSAQSTILLNTIAPDSSEEDDDDIDMDTSFVTDSPVKVPTGSKSFQLLFDESSAPMDLKVPIGKAPIGRIKSPTKLGALFGTSVLSHANKDIEWGIKDSVPGGKNNNALPNSKSPPANKPPHQSIFVKVTPGVVHLAQKPSQGTSVKRPLSDTDVEVLVRNKANSGLRQNRLPTPPLAVVAVDTVENNLSTKIQGKTKRKPIVRGKKTNFSESDSVTDDDESHIPIKIIHRSYARQSNQIAPGKEDDLDFDGDSIPGYIRRISQEGTPIGSNVGLGGGDGIDTFEVINLPEKLRQILALGSVEAKTRDSQEEQIFKGLLYGQRSSHYDPIKGGNIWDAGEDNVRVGEDGIIRRDIEGEDDWEGEPVPWEVGEL